MRLVLLMLLMLGLAACAGPLRTAQDGAALAQPSSGGWWLCDPPGLWEPRR